MPKVSVIIPVYNTEKYLKKCLDSVCNQTLSDIEIICVNDCSPDNSLDILNEYAAKDSRIKVIDFKENKGVSIARNTGINEAVGEYIGFIDSDDYIDLDFYEKLYDKAVETEAECVKGNLQCINENKEEIYSIEYDINDEINVDKAFFYHSFTSAIYKRDFLLSNKVFFPIDISHFEDPYFAIKTAIYCNKIEIVNNTKYYYFINSKSETQQELNINILNNIENSIQKIIALLNQSNISSQHYYIVSNFIERYLDSICKKVKKNNKLYMQAISILKFKIENMKKIKYNFEPKYIKPELLQQMYDKYTNDNVKILVSYIKPSFLFKSKVLTPIHLGRAVEDKNSKDGIQDKESIAWLHTNCDYSDDFEGGISRYNRRVGFLTGTYWAWKNYEKLGNPEYFGSFGYRKLLIPSFLSDIDNYDLIVPNERFLLKTIKKQVIECHGKNMYDTIVDLIKDTYPNELDNVLSYLQKSSGYFYEIYVMKKEIFFDFCNWIFKILFRFFELYNNDFIKPNPMVQDQLTLNASNNEFRDIAFILERLTGYYLYKLTKNNDIKYNTVEVVSTEEVNKSIISLLRKNMKLKK